jgi:hypothetical protein
VNAAISASPPRRSRTPRVFAMLIITVKIHVRSGDRPSNFDIPFNTPIQVSWTTSSAIWWLRT